MTCSGYIHMFGCTRLLTASKSTSGPKKGRATAASAAYVTPKVPRPFLSSPRPFVRVSSHTRVKMGPHCSTSLTWSGALPRRPNSLHDRRISPKRALRLSDLAELLERTMCVTRLAMTGMSSNSTKSIKSHACRTFGLPILHRASHATTGAQDENGVCTKEEYNHTRVGVELPMSCIDMQGHRRPPQDRHPFVTR